MGIPYHGLFGSRGNVVAVSTSVRLLTNADKGVDVAAPPDAAFLSLERFPMKKGVAEGFRALDPVDALWERFNRSFDLVLCFPPVEEEEDGLVAG